MADEHFNVCQFFDEKTYEYVRRNVNAEKAIKAARFYTSNVSSRLGLTVRVIVTDMDDCICFEWKYGEGVVFPPLDQVIEHINE